MSDEKGSAEDWAWERIGAGETANFNAEFGELDPKKPDGWNDDRKIGARFLRRIFSDQRDIPIEGARIVGAFLPEGLVLQSGHVNRDVWLFGCRSENSIDFKSTTFDGSVLLMDSWVEGRLDLDGAKIAGIVSMMGSTFEAELDCSGVQVGRSLIANNTIFRDNVTLLNAKIGGSLSIAGAILEKTLNGDNLSVGQNLSMAAKATFRGDVTLGGAKIGRLLDLRGSTFEQALHCYGLHVGQALAMEENAFFKGDVDLVGAKIDAQINMSASTFEKPLNCNSLQVGQNFVMKHALFKGDVDLTGAKIGFQLIMNGSTFEKHLSCNGLQVSQSVFMSDKATLKGELNIIGAKIGGQLAMTSAIFENTLHGDNLSVGQDLLFVNSVCKAVMQLPFARVGGTLDLRMARLVILDLTGAEVVQELRLAGEGHTVAWSWSDSPRLAPFIKLRNTRVGTLQDSLGAWPPAADLEGFSYGYVGGFGTVSADDPRIRSVKEWKYWLAKDNSWGRRYSPQPYAQLANVLVAAGRRDYANAILFAGRQRERLEAFRDHRWSRWLWLSVLRWLCGYGIGVQTFWVLPWIVGSVLVGTAVLWFGAPMASHEKGLFWCVGASLDRLLPIIQLNKEFADFFNDPERKRLTGTVIAFFAALRLWGWILGSFLIAALSGLTQRS